MNVKYQSEGVDACKSPSKILQTLVEAVIIIDSAMSNKLLKLESGAISLQNKSPDGLVILKNKVQDDGTEPAKVYKTKLLNNDDYMYWESIPREFNVCSTIHYIYIDIYIYSITLYTLT